MAERLKSPFSLKCINSIYGVKAITPLIDQKDQKIEFEHQNAKKNSDRIKSLIIKYLKDVQPQQTPLQKNREEVQEIINDIHGKGFIGWMLTKKQMRNFNKQNRLGNKEYTTNLIRRVESTSQAQLLKKQSTIFSEEMAQNLSPSSPTSSLKISQLVLERQSSSSAIKKVPLNVSVISTDEKPLPKKQSILLNNYKSQDSLLKENNLNFSENEPQTEKNILAKSQFSNAQRSTPVRDVKKNIPILLNLPNHIRTGSLPTNLNQVQQSENLRTDRQINSKSKFKNSQQRSFPRSINITDREHYKQSQDNNLKQVFSNDSTCYNSNTIPQIVSINNQNSTQKGFLSERHLNNENVNFANQFKTSRYKLIIHLFYSKKVLSSEEKALEKYIRQSSAIQNIQSINFKKYQDVRSQKIWQTRRSYQFNSKVTNDLDSMKKKQEVQKEKVDKQLKNAQELYNLEECPVITQQMQKKNREIMHSPFFEYLTLHNILCQLYLIMKNRVNIQEPYRKTLLLYDYLEDESKFNQRGLQQDTKITQIQKTEAFKKFNHFVQKYKLTSQI